MPKDLDHMAELDHLGYGSPLELLSEKFHASESLLQALNPGQTFDAAGVTITVPNVRAARTTGKVVKIEVDKAARALRAFGPGRRARRLLSGVCREQGEAGAERDLQGP